MRRLSQNNLPFLLAALFTLLILPARGRDNQDLDAAPPTIEYVTAKGDPVPAIRGTRAFSVEQGQILFTGAINGRQCRMGIDTGSLTTLIDENFAKVIGISFRGHPTKSEFPRSFATELRVGKTVLKRVPIQIVSRLPTDTIFLGMDVLRDSILAVDFLKQKLSFGALEDRSASLTELPLDIHGRPYLSASVGSHPCRFLVDLGSPANIMSEQKLSELTSSDSTLSSRIHETRLLPQLESLVREKESARLMVVPVKLDDITLEIPMAVFRKERGEPAILGLNFFRQYQRVTLNFPRSRLSLGSKMDPNDL